MLFLFFLKQKRKKQIDRQTNKTYKNDLIKSNNHLFLQLEFLEINLHNSLREGPIDPMDVISTKLIPSAALFNNAIFAIKGLIKSFERTKNLIIKTELIKAVDGVRTF